MKQSISLLLIGTVAYGLFLIATLPMSLALKWLPDLPAQIAPYEVHGSILDGGATALLWRNWRLDRLQWQFAPLQLLRGRLAYTLQFSIPEGAGSATFGVGIGGGAQLRQLDLKLPLKYLSQQWSLPTRFGGDIQVNLAELAIEDHQITDARGTLTWSQAHLRADPPVPLGDFEAQLEAQEQDGTRRYQGPISDDGGPLNASGSLQLNSDGHWRMHGKLALRDPSRKAIAHLLSSLGRPGADGKVPFDLKGQLPLGLAQ